MKKIKIDKYVHEAKDLDDAMNIIGNLISKEREKLQREITENMIILASKLLGEELNPVTPEDFKKIASKINEMGYEFKSTSIMDADLHNKNFDGRSDTSVIQGKTYLRLIKKEEENGHDQGSTTNNNLDG